jgi:hypothetical protein
VIWSLLCMIDVLAAFIGKRNSTTVCVNPIICVNGASEILWHRILGSIRGARLHIFINKVLAAFSGSNKSDILAAPS